MQCGFRLFRPYRVTAVALIAAAASAVMTDGSVAQANQTEVKKTVPGNLPPAPPPAPAPAPENAPIQQGASNAPANSWQTDLAADQTPASPEAKSKIIADVNNYFNSMTNLQGTFIQTDPDSKQKRGKFYFQRPGKVRFDYGAPSKLRIISNGEYLAIEDHDLNTSDRYPLEMTPFRLLLSPKVDLENDANIISVDQGSDVAVLTVEDKKGDGSGRIRLFFNKPNMSLREWIVTDAQGLSTRIEVSNLETDKQVAANFFEFSKDMAFKALNQ
jgi:outer membrane lipoprotein-sorting protein